MGRDPDGLRCAGCNAPITRVGSRGPLPTYCSPGCRYRAGHMIDADRRRDLRAGLVCEGCGATFCAVKKLARFCDRSCGARHRRKVKGKIMTATVEGELIQSDTGDRLSDLRAKLVNRKALIAEIGRAMRREERAMRTHEREQFGALRTEIESISAESKTLGAK